jgi:hypothetical protein
MRKEDIKSLYLGVGWKARRETREQCAKRISDFLCASAGIDGCLENWFVKGVRSESSRSKADVSPEGIGRLLKTNNRDATGEPITELGFNIGLWNGGNASFSTTIGAFSPSIENVALLRFVGPCALERAQWYQLINNAVSAFEPDSAVITSDHPDWPLKDVGWFTYSRGGEVAESMFENGGD